MRSISVIAGSTIRLALESRCKLVPKQEHGAHDMWQHLGFCLFASRQLSEVDEQVFAVLGSRNFAGHLDAGFYGRSARVWIEPPT